MREETGRFTNDGAAYDLYVELHHLLHAADDGQLLVVLLAEVGAVGLYHAEQLAYDLHDAVEVAWAHLAFHNLVKAAEVELERGAHLLGRVHFLGRGGEDEVGVDAGEQLGVTHQIARIFGEVFLVVELRRIDEDGDERDFVFADAATNKAGVTFVKRAHCRNETYRFPLSVAGCNGQFQLCFCLDDLHIILKIAAKLLLFFDMCKFF